MKYDLAEFNKAVRYYESNLRKYKGKTVFVAFDSINDKAYFSMAPLSRAAHNLNIEMSVSLYHKKSEQIDALMDVWIAFAALDMGIQNEKTKALDEFIALVDKSAKGEFRNIFIGPDLLVYANANCFISNKGEKMEFHQGWFRKHRWNELLATARVIWSQVYDLKKTEKVGMGFDLISKASDMKYPLEDYLDSYAIARTMFLACPSGKKTMKAVTSKKTMLEKGERTSELSVTILGCELEKEINEPIFKAYGKLSKLLMLDRFTTNQASFYIKGEGYGGKHIFGECIGYPTPNRKSRWDGPGGIIYQFPWYPQTKIDGRGPRCRVGFTDTLPIDIYIESCNIDWLKMKKIDDKLIALGSKSDRIFVESDKTTLEIGLIKKNGERRELMNSDVDIRTLLDIAALKKGIKAGNMANIPGGEMFLTPEYVKGKIYGDVIINIDKSYVLSAKNPLIIKCSGNQYSIVSGPKEIIRKMKEKKNEAMKMLLRQEKNKSLPVEIIDMKKKNFGNIGEFAINTNPKARLCKYLIVNEKIAGMIHLALGSGFESDRSSVYHYDTVINAIEQKLDIYGMDSKGKKYWMMRKGKLTVQ
jgi:hypothetical protein